MVYNKKEGKAVGTMEQGTFFERPVHQPLAARLRPDTLEGFVFSSTKQKLNSFILERSLNTIVHISPYLRLTSLV